MARNPTINANILSSFEKMTSRYGGRFASMKQRAYLVKCLAKASIHEPIDLDETGALNSGKKARSRVYTVSTSTGKTRSLRVHGRHEAPHVEFIDFSEVSKMLAELAPVAAPAILGPIVDEETRELLRELLRWGPSEFAFLAPGEKVRIALIKAAGIPSEELEMHRSRAADAAWTEDDLTWITRIQIAAKGLLCEIGDNAGTSPVSMTPADAAYISEMITEGHIRNAHWFKRASMPEKALRRATIVNKAKMDPATAALASRMVELMNDEARRLGRPVGFAEYVEIMTEEAA